MTDQRVDHISDRQVDDISDRQVDDDFLQLTGPYRRELLAHCYRMLGSVHDAEDLVQETYLRAWRAYHGFEGRSSLRTWLYRIATNVCLTAIDSRGRRPLPTGLGAPSSDPSDPLTELAEVLWLEPVPDAMVADPASVVETRASVRLALVAALQHLPARQRAVLVLRDVLMLRAAEVADMLDTSVAAVNSSLQRARAQLDEAGLTEDEMVEPTEPGQRELLDRYARALEAKDIPALVAVFTDDAVFEMPPFASWYRGPQDIGRLVGTHCPARPGGLRLVATQANGQPAFAVYLRDQADGWQAFQLQVLRLVPGGISHVAAFFDTTPFPTFGLPTTLPAGTAASPERALASLAP